MNRFIRYVFKRKLENNSFITSNPHFFDKKVYSILRVLHKKSKEINVDSYIEETLNPKGLKKYKKVNELKFWMNYLNKAKPIQLELLNKQLKKNGVKFDLSYDKKNNDEKYSD